jgi:hypothetical protein
MTRSALLLFASCAAIGCTGRTIRAEYAEMFARLPSPDALATCANSQARIDQHREILTLLAEVKRARRKYDGPLGEPLRARLLRASHQGLDADYPCLTHDPARDAVALQNMGALAGLLFDRADLQLAQGDLEGGYASLKAAFALYDKPFARGYIWYLGVTYFVERARKTIAEHPAPPKWSAELARRTAAATLDRATFCRGVQEEYVQQVGMSFYGYLRPMREKLLARWGDELKPALDDPDYADGSKPPLAVFKAYRAAFEPVLDKCASSAPMQEVNALAQAGLERLRAASSAHASMAGITLDRINFFIRLEAARAKAAGPH